MKRYEWSNLPEELISLIADHSSSNFDRLRIRSLCNSWRSSISAITANTAIPKPLFLTQHPSTQSLYDHTPHLISQVIFLRLSLPSSSPHKGWLIKIQQHFKSTKPQLISPLSDHLIDSYTKTLDLLKFTVSEISKCYCITTLSGHELFKRVIVFPGKDLRVFLIDKNKIWYWSNQTNWYEIHDEFRQDFLDIILHKGLLYALDFKGAIWWISSSDFNIYPYARASPEIGENVFSNRFVEFDGDLCIISCRIPSRRCRNGGNECEGIGFKVYKMDEELVRLEEIKCLGDKSILMAKERCVCVKASDYYGCLENVIYFNEKRSVMKVFKLEDGSVSDMYESCSSHSTEFKMFCSCFFLNN